MSRGLLTYPGERIEPFPRLSLLVRHGDAHQELGEQPRAHLAVREACGEDEDVHVLGLVRVLRFHLDPQRALAAPVADLLL